MKIDRARLCAVLVVLATPIIGGAVTEYLWQGNCDHYVHGSYGLFAIFAAILIFTKNPYRAIAACFAYLPVSYIFATEPCTDPRSQGAGGLIYLLAPMFVSFVVLGAFVGGFFLRLMFGLEAASEQQIGRHEPLEGQQEGDG